MNAAQGKNPRRDIDFSRPFTPAHTTALFHAPSWHLLTATQQIRYTQLYALYLNEQTAFFEELLASTLLPALYRRPDRIGDELAENLRTFEAEEKRHSQWFREMNHRIDSATFPLTPENYVFIPGGRAMRAIGKWLASRPFAFPFWIWLVLLQEERSIFIAQESIAPRSGIEPNFRELQRRHLADEIGHVRWDTQLVERVWLPMPMWKRKLHARLFGHLMAEFFTVPKRSAIAVLNALLAEFSDLAPIAPQLRRELSDLKHSTAYHASLYSREVTPKAFALFDSLPEFADIGKYLPAYERRSRVLQNASPDSHPTDRQQKTSPP